MAKTKIFIGPAGWSYPDWKGNFYPRRMPSGQSQLSYLAQYFNLVEINSTFYRIPTIKMTENWLRQIEQKPDFQFTCKLFQHFTHQPDKLNRSAIDQFRTGLKPLVEANRLLAVLVQFPWSFKNNTDNRARLDQLFDFFPDLPLAIEVRHQSWNQTDFIQYLHEKHAGFVNIDQPVIGKSIGLTNYMTSGRLAYFRFHGRNYDTWFDSAGGRNARYDYLYSAKEQDSLADLISQIMQNNMTLIIVYNNHFRGQALANAFQMKFRFEKERQSIPSQLRQVFPQLSQIYKSQQVGKTMDIFGDDDSC
ncbi:MAG: DUF72 domain-containing protein [Methanosarcinaceae archaeon]